MQASLQLAFNSSRTSARKDDGTKLSENAAEYQSPDTMLSELMADCPMYWTHWALQSHTGNCGKSLCKVSWPLNVHQKGNRYSNCGTDVVLSRNIEVKTNTPNVKIEETAQK